MPEKFQVKASSTLLPFLHDTLKGWPRRTVKQRLQAGCVSVNGTPTTQHNHPLNSGDCVEVGAAGKRIQPGAFRLEVLFSDKQMVAINKPAGLLSVGTVLESKQHALSILRNQLSRPRESVKLWPVNRLDRETSGVMLFATSRRVREAITEQWAKAEKSYLAIVEGKPKENKGTIDEPLWSDPVTHQVNVGPNRDAKEAITHYEVLRSGKGRSLLRVHLETGRQHQIRAHMAWLGHPIVGDARYGTKGPDLGLHAQSLTLPHPLKETTVTIEVSPPAEFTALMP